MADEQKANKVQGGQQTGSSRGKRKSSNRSKIGGTAIPGAKSMQPKPTFAEVKDPNEQQLLSYNRDMRRRMQQMGTGPSGQQDQMDKMRDKRDKRIARKKQRLDERRQQALKAVPKSSMRLGKGLFFLIGVVGVILLLVVIFAILRLTHVL